MRTCNDVMTANPTCCLGSDPVKRAAEIMKKEDVGAIPVVDDLASGKLIGIITDRDIVLNLVATSKDVQTRIEEVMTRNPVTCRPDDDITTAMDRMGQHQIRRIPVVDGKGKIVGIIAQADVATRTDQPEKTAGVLEDISQPVS